jgi:outer membrane receptor protein involved in Fe transport
VTVDDVHWNFTGALVSDELKSSSLLFGNYRTRKHLKLAVVPEKEVALSNRRQLTGKLGVAYDDTNRNDSAFSPIAELGLNHVAPALGISRVYASYSRASQTTTYFALNSNPTRGLFRGNPNLGRQTADNYEIGAVAGSGSLTLTSAVFFRRDDKLVDWTYSSLATNARAANAVDIDTTGFEFVGRYTSKSFDAVLGYTALHKNADYGAAAVDASFYALNYPLQRLTLALTARLGHGVELRFDNEYRVQDKNALRKSTRTPLISSIGVYCAIPRVRGLRVSAEIENLWNSDFEEVPAVPAAKRQVSFGVSYAW